MKGGFLVASAAFFEYKEDGGRFPNPPSYSVATTLPSYDEAERSKEEAAIPLVAGRVMVGFSSWHISNYQKVVFFCKENVDFNASACLRRTTLRPEMTWTMLTSCE